MVDQALELWAAEPTTLPAPLFVAAGWGGGDPTLFEDLPMAFCSPHKIAEGGSRMTMPLTLVSKLLLSNMTILLSLPVPGGVLVAMMAMPLTWMPAPFDGAGPSQGGREGIDETEEKNLHRNLGSIPIVLTPFLRIPPYSWYRNQNRIINHQLRQYANRTIFIAFSSGRADRDGRRLPLAEYWG